MFRGLNSVHIDSKGRLAVPTRFRDGFRQIDCNLLVLTLNPWDRSIWLYPQSEWEHIEHKLSALADNDRNSRRTKQIMRGYATDCILDNQGRILLPAELREIAGLEKKASLLGQGNKLELWNSDVWEGERERWLAEVTDGSLASSEALDSLAL
jgi:MraZ protein